MVGHVAQQNCLPGQLESERGRVQGSRFKVMPLSPKDPSQGSTYMVPPTPDSTSLGIKMLTCGSSGDIQEPNNSNGDFFFF